jgi:hypothetical protein
MEVKTLSVFGEETDWSDVLGYGSVWETIFTASPRGLEMASDEAGKRFKVSIDWSKQIDMSC